MTDRSSDQVSGAPDLGSEPVALPENLMRHYAGVVRRRGRWIAVWLVVGLLAGLGSTLFMNDQPNSSRYFKATNTLVIDASNSGGISLPQVALAVQSQALLDDLAKRLKLSQRQIAHRLSAVPRSDVQAIDVTGIATSPAVAVGLANAGADELRRVAEKTTSDQAATNRIQLQSQIDSLDKLRQDLSAKIRSQPENADVLNKQLDDVQTNYSQTASQLQDLGLMAKKLDISTLQPATPIEINARGYNFRISQNVNARSQLSPGMSMQSLDFDETALGGGTVVSRRTRLIIGAAAGLVLGLVCVFVVEAWDDRIRRRSKVEAMTGLPVLAEIPQLDKDNAAGDRLAMVDDPTGVASERYRAARTSVLFALDSRPRHGDAATPSDSPVPVVMVTSPGPGEGKTTTAANLAVAFADGGMRTLVVDGDFRRPTIRRYLHPVTDLMAPDEPCETRVDRVRFVAGPSGARTPDDAIHALRGMLDRWRDDYDIIVLDTPPILATNDAADLLDASDAVVLVLRSGQTRSGPAQLVVSLLSRFRADVLGVVLNGCDRSEMNPYYGYGYGYLGTKASSAAIEDHAVDNHDVDSEQMAGVAVRSLTLGT